MVVWWWRIFSHQVMVAWYSFDTGIFLHKHQEIRGFTSDCWMWVSKNVGFSPTKLDENPLLRHHWNHHKKSPHNHHKIPNDHHDHISPLHHITSQQKITMKSKSSPWNSIKSTYNGEKQYENPRNHHVGCPGIPHQKAASRPPASVKRYSCSTRSDPKSQTVLMALDLAHRPLDRRFYVQWILEPPERSVAMANGWVYHGVSDTPISSEFVGLDID